MSTCISILSTCDFVLLDVFKSDSLHSLFSFLQYVATGIILAHTIPFIYDTYEDVIDDYLIRAGNEAQKHYSKFDAAVLSKIPRAPAKEKKVQ